MGSDILESRDLCGKVGVLTHLTTMEVLTESIRSADFLQYLFDQPAVAEMAARIVDGVLAGRSARLSEIAEHMSGSSGANYKAIQRFVAQTDSVVALSRMFQAGAPFVIGDATEMPRPQSYRIDYVGKLGDDETRGLLAARPGHAVSRPGHPAPPVKLLVALDCSGCRLTQHVPLASLRLTERPAGRQALGA